MVNLSRRRFVATTPVVLGLSAGLPGCAAASGSGPYEAAAQRIRQPGCLAGTAGTALGLALVGQATLAASSHNTQCWKFMLEHHAILLSADDTRLCPAVDPDQHHTYVSLGCATENLVHAALACGLHAEPAFEAGSGQIRLNLSPTPARPSPLSDAILTRQCTRGEYDAQPLSRADLSLLEQAGTSAQVRLLLITARPAIEQVLDAVVQANTTQMGDAAFVRELKSWIRFNEAAALGTGDGLYSGCTGNPRLPTWLGEMAFRWFFTPGHENAKYVRQLRSSAGIAVFTGRTADHATWVEVGRCYERFALQATALGIRNAFVNQPVEVITARPQFASAVGLPGQRPDLVVRFGRGPTLPWSLRRPVQSVLA